MTNKQTVMCCGKEHCTPFCPHCGKKLFESNNLYGLFARCRQTERKIRTEIANLQSCAGKNDRNVIDRIKSKEIYADQWKRWGDALWDVLENEKKS